MLFKIIDISYGWFEVDFNRKFILTNSDYLGCDAPALLLEALGNLMDGTASVQWLCWQDEPGAYILKLTEKDGQLTGEIYDTNKESIHLAHSGDSLAKHITAREYHFKEGIIEAAKAIVAEFGLYEKGNGKIQYRLHWGDFPHKEYGRLKQMLQMSKYSGVVPEGKLNGYQKNFFRHISVLQEAAVQTAILRYEGTQDIEEMLYDATHSVIMDIMVTIDGYSSFTKDKMDIINQNTGSRLKENPFIELHDAIGEYIKSEIEVREGYIEKGEEFNAVE